MIQSSDDQAICIDAHHHLWDRQRTDFEYRWLDTPENERISASHLPEHLISNLQAAGVDYSVVVQTQHRLQENDWALSLAQQHSWIAGVVGWIDLTSDDCDAQLESYRHQPKFVGVRHVVQEEADDFIVRPDVIRGLQVLQRRQVPFDLLVFQRQLHHAPTVARSCPDLPMVLDHLGKPRVADVTGGYSSWLPLIQQVADCPNVYCKLSGLVTEADMQNWKPADLRPYFETAIDLFGPERCMFGSDWPVCRLASEYDRVIAALRDVIARLSTHEQSQIMAETAVKFYQLKIPSGDGATPDQ